MCEKRSKAVIIMSEYIWAWLILLYGVVKGLRETLKKKAMETNSVLEVLFFYTLFAFVMIIPFSHGVFCVSFKYHIVLLVKAFGDAPVLANIESALPPSGCSNTLCSRK